MNFLDFLRQSLLADASGGPVPEAAPVAGQQPMGQYTRVPVRQMTPMNHMTRVDDPFMALLSLMQAGAEAGRPGRMGGPMLGGAGTGGAIDLSNPDVGDLYDTNNEGGGSPLQGMFGQAPVPLRQAPPGINQRRPGKS